MSKEVCPVSEFCATVIKDTPAVVAEVWDTKTATKSRYIKDCPYMIPNEFCLNGRVFERERPLKQEK
jgi:hypothetical protein